MNASDTELIIDTTPPAPRRSRHISPLLAAAAVCVAALTVGLALVAQNDGSAPRIVDVPMEAPLRRRPPYARPSPTPASWS